MYNLVRIPAGDEWKTSFSTTSGLYEYNVMAHGLVNVPSFFQSFMNDVFRDMFNHFVVVYIDDILIYSKSYPEHIRVLRRLREHSLYVKAEKCVFHESEIAFFGYHIGPDRVSIERNKCPVTEWAEPTTMKELQWFLGFANFYRRFI